jgi:hypothetical protein
MPNLLQLYGWRWRQFVSPKRLYLPTSLHGVITRKKNIVKRMNEPRERRTADAAVHICVWRSDWLLQVMESRVRNHSGVGHGQQTGGAVQRGRRAGRWTNSVSTLALFRDQARDCRELWRTITTLIPIKKNVQLNWIWRDSVAYICLGTTDWIINID